MSGPGDKSRTILAALCGGAMIGQHTASRAARDAIFLTEYDVTALAPMQIVSSISSVLLAALLGRWMTRVTPAVALPRLYFGSAALWAIQWWFLGFMPRVGAAIMFLHVAALGGVLISGFWSLLNEVFDPHSGKAALTRVTLGTNIGALLGGLLAERVAANTDIVNLLPFLSALHVFSALALMRLARAIPDDPVSDKGQEALPSGIAVIGRNPYLRNVALMVLLMTVAVEVADYVFKTQAALTFERNELARFFATFYTVVNAITLAYQARGAGWTTQRLGLAATIALMPLSIALFAAIALLPLGWSPLYAIGALVAVRSILQNSVYRSGYELLYMPVSADAKRAAKTLIDVAFDKLGSAAGAGVVAGLLLIPGDATVKVMIGTALVMAAIAYGVTRRLNEGYVEALRASLVDRSLELNEGPSSSKLRAATIVDQPAPDLARPLETGSLRLAGEPVRISSRRRLPDSIDDPTILRLADIRSRDLPRVTAAIAKGPLDPHLVYDVIGLLAWDEAQPIAANALRQHAQEFPGAMADRLLDKNVPFAIRRRLPRLMRGADPERVVPALWQTMGDRRFEVRYQSGQTLLHLSITHPDVSEQIGPQLIRETVLKELSVSTRMWRKRRLLDQPNPEDAKAAFQLDGALARRADRSLQHVFSLLALIHPRQALRVAFRGLHTEDGRLRGTALEYLHTTLSPAVREKLWPFIAEGPLPEVQTGAQEVLTSLMLSASNIEASLEALQEQLEAEDATNAAKASPTSEK